MTNIQVELVSGSGEEKVQRLFAAKTYGFSTQASEDTNAKLDELYIKLGEIQDSLHMVKNPSLASWYLKSSPSPATFQFTQLSTEIPLYLWRNQLLAPHVDRDTASPSEEPNSELEYALVGEVGVPLSSLLKFLGTAMLIASLSSLAFWLVALPPLINPFVSILTLCASPFVVAMGFAAKR